MIKRFILIIICLSFLFIIGPNHPLKADNSDFALVWSADTYTPSGYTGKSLPTINSQITAAIISKKNSNFKNYYYSWYLDNNLDEKASGLGKDEFSFLSLKPANNTYAISVRIGNKNGLFVDNLQTIIKVDRPQVIIYQSSDKSINILSKEITANSNSQINIFALPYFFNILNLNDLDFKWRLQNQPEAKKTSEQNPNFLFLKTGLNAKQSLSRLYLEVNNKKISNQKAENHINILFIP